MTRKRLRTDLRSDDDDDGGTEIHAASSPAPGPAAAPKKSQRERRWAKKKAKLLLSMRAVPSLPAAGPANGDGGGASSADSHELSQSDNKESQSDEKESQSEPEPDGDDGNNDDDDDDDDGSGGGGEGGGGNEGEPMEQAGAQQDAVRKPSEQGEAVQMQPASNDERQQHADDDVQRKYFQPYQFPAMPREEDRALFDMAPPQMRVHASARPRTPLATVYCAVCTSTLHTDDACPELTVRMPTDRKSVV